MRQVSHVVSSKSKLCMSHYTLLPPLYPLMPCLVSQMWKSAWMRWDMFCLCLSGITLTEGKRPTLCSAVKGDKYHHLHWEPNYSEQTTVLETRVSTHFTKGYVHL